MKKEIEQLKAIENYVTQYDEFIQFYRSRVEYSICKNNVIRTEKIHCLRGTKFVREDNILLFTAISTSRIFSCCITFIDVLCTKESYNTLKNSRTALLLKDDGFLHLHVCNICPIMIGSLLDTIFSKNIDAQPTNVDLEQKNGFLCNWKLTSRLPVFTNFDIKRENHLETLFCSLFRGNVKNKLIGYFVVNGEIVSIPYILENNRESLHKYADKETKKKSLRFFLYNNNFRGYKFNLDCTDNSFHCKDKNGRIHNEFDCNSSKDIIDFRNEFNFSETHILFDANCIKKTLLSLSAFCSQIDDMNNKIILPPCVTIYKLLDHAEKNPQSAFNILTSGNFSKMISQKLSYDTSMLPQKLNSSTIKPVAISNLFRRPLANQVGECDVIFNITRLAQDKLKKSTIPPSNMRGFICFYDIHPNIKNYAKTLNLVYDIQFAPCCSLLDFDRIFSLLLDANVIEHNGSAEKYTAEVHKMQILLRLLPTPYVLCVPFDIFFEKLKTINPFVEIRKHCNFVSLNIVLGMPLKPYKNFLLTSFEINTYFPKAYDSPGFVDTSITGLQFLKYQKYESHERSIISAGYLKSRVTSVENLPLFFLTNEVCSIFIDKISCGDKTCSKKKFVLNDDNTLTLNTMIAATPEVNEDAFVLDKNIDVNAIIVKKYNHICEIEPGTVIHQIDNSTCANFILNSYGEREYVLVKLFTMYTKTNIQMPAFGKITCTKLSDCVFEFTKCLTDNSLLSVESISDIKINTTLSTNVCSGSVKLEIFLHVAHKCSFFSGLKLANLVGSKGLVFLKDLSTLKTINGQTPDLIASAFGVVGRSVLSQPIEMGENGFEDVFINGKKVGVMAKCKFFIIKNCSSELKINGKIKIDNLTSNAMINNALPVSLFTLLQDSLGRDEKFLLLPRSNRNLLELYKVQKLSVLIEGDEMNAHRHLTQQVRSLIALKKKVETLATKTKSYQKHKLTSDIVRRKKLHVEC